VDEMRVYKVVYEKHGCCYSAIIGTLIPSHWELAWRVTYKDNKKKYTVPDCFAFDTLENARKFHGGMLDRTIYLAEAEEVITEPLVPCIDQELFILHRYNKPLHHFRNRWQTPPEGTVRCKNLKLVRRIP
jgi:hypothetical protein